MSYKLSLGLPIVAFTTSNSFTIMSSFNQAADANNVQTLIDFIGDAHPKTLEWIVREHLPQLQRVDLLTRMQSEMADIRALSEEFNV